MSALAALEGLVSEPQAHLISTQMAMVPLLSTELASRNNGHNLIRHLATASFHLSFRFQSMSGYSEEHLKSKLLEKLGAEHVEVTDVSDGCGGKFEVVIGEATNIYSLSILTSSSEQSV